jgi:hypothetical protein
MYSFTELWDYTPIVFVGKVKFSMGENILHDNRTVAYCVAAGQDITSITYRSSRTTCALVVTLCNISQRNAFSD